MREDFEAIEEFWQQSRKTQRKLQGRCGFRVPLHKEETMGGKIFTDSALVNKLKDILK